MELKAGMYVRTEDGYIFKIKELLEKEKYNDSDNKIVQRFRIDGMYKKNDDYIETDYMYSDWIIKANHNIIDLIEVGDYVNGNEVMNISDFKDGSRYLEFDEGRYLCKNYQIKSIVTKEQFKSMEYIVSLLEVREPKFINGKEVKFLSEKKNKKKKVDE